MHIPDYDRALYYMLWGQWDDLLVLMVRTEDDLLSKKIHHFLSAYHYAIDQVQVIQSHDQLLDYIDHAMKQTTQTTMELV